MLPPSKRFKMENSIAVHQNGIEMSKTGSTFWTASVLMSGRLDILHPTDVFLFFFSKVEPLEPLQILVSPTPLELLRLRRRLWNPVQFQCLLCSQPPVQTLAPGKMCFEGLGSPGPGGVLLQVGQSQMKNVTLLHKMDPLCNKNKVCVGELNVSALTSDHWRA